MGLRFVQEGRIRSASDHRTVAELEPTGELNVSPNPFGVLSLGIGLGDSGF
jgi:hypothetical protein